MDMEDRLKQKIKEDQKISVIIGIVFCAVLCVMIVILAINRVAEIKSGDTESTTWLSFGIVCLLIGLIVIFAKYILLVCINSKKDCAESHEEIRIVVKEVKTKMSLLYGAWSSNVFVENLETGEQFLLEGCGDMIENETYCMLRAKYSKQFVYEHLDINEQK